MMTAIHSGVPIVAVQLAGGPFTYDFVEAAELLTRIDSKLPEADMELLISRGLCMQDVAYHLSNVIPTVISHKLDPAFSRAVLHAVLSDLLESMAMALPSPIAPPPRPARSTSAPGISSTPASPRR